MTTGTAPPRSWRGSRPGRLPRGLVALCTLIVGIVVAPVVVTTIQAFQGGIPSAERTLSAPGTSTLLLNTLLVTLIATPAAAVFGVGAAWLVERTRLPGRKLWAVLLVAPLTIPPFVTSYAWASLSSSLQGVLGAAGIIAFSYFPIVFLVVSASLRGMDPALEESARSLGLDMKRTFFRVIVPQLRPALLGGVLLVILDTLVEFDAFVALKLQTFSTDISAQYQLSFSPSGAAALALISTVICVVLLFAERKLRRGVSFTRISQGARRALPRYPLGRSAPLALGGLGLLVAISVGIPVAMLVRWFTQSNAGFQGAAAGLDSLLPSSITSVGLGVSAAAVAVAFALPLAILIVRYRGRAVSLLEGATYLSFALPDLVAGIALAYASTHWLRFLSGTLILLILAEAMLFVPFAVVAIRASLGQLEPGLEDSARALGAGTARRLWRITLPLSRPGLAAAAVLVFSFTLGDLSSAQILLPPNLNTLGTQFQANASTVAFGAAAPFAAVLIGFSVVAAYILMNSFGRISDGHEA